VSSSVARTIDVESMMRDGTVNLKNTRLGGTPPTPNFVAGVGAAPFTTNVKSARGTERKASFRGVSESGDTRTGAAAVSSDALMRRRTGAQASAVEIRSPTPFELTSLSPTRRRVPFVTRSSTVSVEIGILSVSRSDSGANVFEPISRLGRNSGANTDDT